jgi:hypothetical protein
MCCPKGIPTPLHTATHAWQGCASAGYLDTQLLLGWLGVLNGGHRGHIQLVWECDKRRGLGNCILGSFDIWFLFVC